jgi:hypothetical protein
MYTPVIPIREQISFKQHENYIRVIRDRLCTHYKLNKSDLVKYLIKKEELALKRPDGVLM